MLADDVFYSPSYLHITEEWLIHYGENSFIHIIMLPLPRV